ncbi:MAG: penicillin acylase family protein [Desulfatibacillum sp.]|nr:penicillin acylase family protein [Desulfatibacillum sp.]
MKIVKIVMFALIVVVLAAVPLYHLFFRLPLPKYSGALDLEGLTAPVTVHTDEYGIPHIYAENEGDLFLAQGYVTARERMFQMDLARLAGRGELSTVMGEVTLEKDRFLRTIGFYRRAREIMTTMPPRTARAIADYTRGVNAYIQSADHLPREYFFLRSKPRAWTSEDSVAIALLMSYSLTRSKKVDLVLHRIGQVAGPEVLEAIIPGYPDFAPTLTGKPPVNFAPGLQGAFLADAVSLPGTGDDFMPNFEIPASNWMIFSGSRTESGKALFAGSPDLEPTLPALFFIMHLQGGEYDVMGGALPGCPGIGPLGYNGHIAWSAVNGRGDELDFFVEKMNPDNPDQYLTEEGYRNFSKISEVIKVKNGDGFREEPLEVRITRHGPVISQIMPLAPENCTMQWAALDIEKAWDLHGLLAMNRAANFNEFRQALEHVKAMNLNLGYADKNGNIGWQFTASPPVRKKGNGSLPAPGWTGEYDWTGFVPYEDLPFDYNPEKGYTASFNNDPGNVPYHLTNYYLFERAIRFEDIMRDLGDEKVNQKRLMGFQTDTISVVAQRWRPCILAACEESVESGRYSELFKKWDCSINTGSNAATLFNAFYYKMMENTLKDEIGEELWTQELAQPYLYYIPDLLMTKIVHQPDHNFYDDQSTPDVREDRNAIIIKSLNQAWEILETILGDDPGQWQWGRVHKMRFNHPLGSKLPMLNLKPIPTQGSHHTINSGFWDWDSAHPFRMKSGGVIRMAVDFSNGDQATIVSPPGQSGHYLSPYYANQAHLWADGRQLPMHYYDGQKLAQTLVLNPAPH